METLFCQIRTVFFTATLLLGVEAVRSQCTIRGIIRDPSGRSVQNANVLLLKSGDSSLVKGSVSDSSGKYFFEDMDTGDYLISVSFAGMQKSISKSFQIVSGQHASEQTVIYLSKNISSLQEVVVNGKKALFEQKTDRSIVNVKSSIINAGGSALDVIEKSPGVSVNRAGSSISVNGKTGAGIMINGKMNYMPADAAVQLLAGIPAANIDRIEFITSPSSKSDASGNAGYINIVFINNPHTGFNGSYFLSAGYGQRPLASAGFTMNYRNSRVNLYGNYSYNHDHYLQPSSGLTQFARSGDVITNQSFSDRDANQDVHNLRIGIDYQLDSSTILGGLLSGYSSRWSMVAHNGATVYKNGLPDTTILSVDDPELNHWQNIMGNINLQHSFRHGQTIFLDANYIFYRDNNPNLYSTDYYSGDKELIRHEDLRTGKITPIHIQVYAADYSAPLGAKTVLEAGAKMALSRFTNDLTADYLQQGQWVPDTALAANYLLKENIAAAYASCNFHAGAGFTVKAGLRYEYTMSNLGSEQKSDLIDRKYGEWFPSVQVSKKIDGTNSIGFSYNRRITRPTFNDLAPFTVFFDPKTYYSGNPALQPAIAHALQANYSYKNYSIALSYTYEKNSINNFYFQTRKVDTSANIVYLSAENLRYQQYFTVSLSLPFTVTHWWSMQNNISLNQRKIGTQYDDQPMVLRNFDFTLNTTQRLSLPKKAAFELTASYSSQSYLGTANSQPRYRVDAGLQKELEVNGDIIRFTAGDIFNSGNDWRFSQSFPVAEASVKRSFNFGLVAYRLSYTHRFGNKSLKVQRERKTGAEEELKRVHN